MVQRMKKHQYGNLIIYNQCITHNRYQSTHPEFGGEETNTSMEAMQCITLDRVGKKTLTATFCRKYTDYQ